MERQVGGASPEAGVGGGRGWLRGWEVDFGNPMELNEQKEPKNGGKICHRHRVHVGYKLGLLPAANSEAKLGTGLQPGAPQSDCLNHSSY